MGTLTKLIEDMIYQLPGVTETGLAGAVLGACNLNQLKQACPRLLKSGKIERRGEGTEKNPFTFYKRIDPPKGSRARPSSRCPAHPAHPNQPNKPNLPVDVSCPMEPNSDKGVTTVLLPGISTYERDGDAPSRNS